MQRRAFIALGVTAATGGFYAVSVARYPKDTTPEGAYLRIANSISRGDPRTTFAYLEDGAQHAGYTIRDFRKKASDRIAESYPEPERSKLLTQYRAHAEAVEGVDIWVEMSARLGWIARLRRDLSGISKTEIAGDRATIETARGTRYAFRRRDNGIWGLTMFTADLLTEAERAARDWEVVEHAALDYDRAR